jgi:glycosyltransferase involved in cell wall biosynthesis
MMDGTTTSTTTREGQPGRARSARALRLLVYEEDANTGGGNRQHLCLLLKHGPAVGMDVVVVTPHEGALASIARRYGAVMTLDPGATRAPYAVRCVRLVKAIRAVDPDAVLCNNTFSFGTGLVAARLTRTRVLWYVKRTRSKPQDIISALVADRVLAISGTVFEGAGRLRSMLTRRAIHLPIGVELDRFMAVPPACPGPQLRVLVLSRIHPNKGFDLLFDALDRLGADAAGMHVTICGGAAPGREAYAAQIEKRAATFRHAAVDFLGFRDDVPAVLEGADAVVLTSRSEGSPRSVVEAMAAGRPVLASRVGGLPELITPGETGLLVDAEDVDGIARMLVWLRDHPHERIAMGARARRDVARRFDIMAHLGALAREIDGLGSRA